MCVDVGDRIVKVHGFSAGCCCSRFIDVRLRPGEVVLINGHEVSHCDGHGVVDRIEMARRNLRFKPRLLFSRKSDIHVRILDDLRLLWQHKRSNFDRAKS